MGKTWYAVQFGDDYEWDFGSYDRNEAEEMARKIEDDERYEGLEIRIAVIDDEYKEFDHEIIIRNGAN